VDLKCSPPETSGFLVTISVLLVLSQCTHTHEKKILTKTQWVYSKTVKCYISSELICFYLLNINFQQCQKKLLYTEEYPWIKLISTNILSDKKYYTLYANEEVVQLESMAQREHISPLNSWIVSHSVIRWSVWDSERGLQVLWRLDYTVWPCLKKRHKKKKKTGEKLSMWLLQMTSHLPLSLCYQVGLSLDDSNMYPK
jgi:hypothetical protein